MSCDCEVCKILDYCKEHHGQEFADYYGQVGSSLESKLYDKKITEKTYKKYFDPFYIDKIFIQWSKKCKLK